MDEHPHEPIALSVADRVHESTDVAVRPLAMFLASLMVSLLLVAIFLAWLFGWFLARTNIEVVSRPGAPKEEFTAPALQISPRGELETFRKHENRQLEATEWVDRKQEVVRIPIERAMELVAERGFPDWPKMDVIPSQSSGALPAAKTPANQDGGSP